MPLCSGDLGAAHGSPGSMGDAIICVNHPQELGFPDTCLTNQHMGGGGGGGGAVGG